MPDMPDSKDKSLKNSLPHKYRAAGLSIMIEDLTRALWQPLSWTLFFCGLWMFQIPLIFGHAIALLSAAVFILGFVFLLHHGLTNLRKPSEHEVTRRIEKDSKTRHRPLSSFKDELANAETAKTKALWQRHQEKVRGEIKHLKLSTPKPLMAHLDHYALRLGILIFFILGLWVSGPGWDERIWNGLTPINIGASEKLERGMHITITPPAYTNLEPLNLEKEDKTKQNLTIPAGSILKARVYGGLGQPYLHIDDQKWPLTHNGGDSYSIEQKIPAGKEIAIKQFFLTKAQWAYELQPDTPPQISLKSEEEPQNLPDGPLRFATLLEDDYGVQTLTLNMTLDDIVEDAPIGEPVTESRSVMSPAGTEFEITPVYDLTAHTWAGLPVVFTLSASDHLNQMASINPIKVTLPERPFQHPVAKAVIALRKKLIWNPKSDYAETGKALLALLSKPAAFQHDIVVFLSLRTAASRLFYAHGTPSVETAQEVIALLWDTALRIEDGNLTLAARNLRDMQMALEEALNNPDTTDAEIAQLMHELRQAMGEYLMELHKEMQKRMTEGEHMQTVPSEMLKHMIDPEGLANFLDQMERELLDGDMESAQEMLSRLQRMMDFMDPSITAPLPFDMQMMAEGVNELQELIDRQETLLKQTENQVKVLQTLKNFQSHYGQPLPQNDPLLEQWGIDGMPPPPQEKKQKPQQKPPTINTQKNKVEQEALRYILGQLMIKANEALGDIPENMGLAEREMMNSSNYLGENNPVSSIPHQEKAIEYLKEAQEQLSQQFIARMQQMTGMSFSGAMRRDPLGRPYGEDGPQSDLFPGSRVELPNEAEKKRAQEILRELRRRSGEFDRPDVELDYYRRLLRRF